MHDLGETTPEPAPEGPSRHRRRLALVAAAVAVAVIAAVPLLWGSLSGDDTEAEDPKPRSAALEGPAGTSPVADFDNDGTQDVHSTGEGRVGRGVYVIYGSHKGRSGSDKAKSGADKAGSGVGEQGRIRMTLDSPGVPGAEGDGVGFGGLTVARDFDGDGYTDLAASVETWRKKSKLPGGTHGGIVVLWGSPKGLDGGSYLDGVPKNYLRTSLDEDQLVAGDMNGDGHSDLVLRLGSRQGLLKGPFGRDGSTGGTAAVPAPLPDTDGLVGVFAADLDGDGSDDLISSHGTDPEGMDSGKVETSWTAGGPDGFRKPDTDVLPGIQTATFGDVDKDGFTDFIMRRYPKDVGPESGRTGPLEVFPGSEQGPDPERRTELDQDSPGVPGHKREFDGFAGTIDAGDADGDGYADVAASASLGEDDGRNGVVLLHGGPEGLTGRGAGLAEEPASSRKEAREQDETHPRSGFGSGLRLGDTDGDGSGDLTIGASRTGDFDGALWTFPARDGKWPQDTARLHRPGDFAHGPGPKSDTLGSDVQ
ncbi:hypothetical protein [Streptomyces sp. YIM 130001]|uniref:hypothetical protein n=1 Tax=Streptomyces sp. YIM 130001 TaxID=2259644 RepID=UPI000E653A0B|nr:hypothetical protein [Streptomyces sp. YIM 130001]